VQKNWRKLEKIVKISYIFASKSIKKITQIYVFLSNFISIRQFILADLVLADEFAFMTLLQGALFAPLNVMTHAHTPRVWHLSAPQEDEVKHPSARELLLQTGRAALFPSRAHSRAAARSNKK
jgi:hypothetical protein